MAFLKSSWAFKPLTTIKEVNVNLRLRNRLSLEAVKTNNASSYDLDTLVTASNMAMALTKKHMKESLDVLVAAADALEAMQKRYKKWGKVQATPTELETIIDMIGVHEQQLDMCQIRDIESALARTKNEIEKCHTDQNTATTPTAQQP